MGTILFLIAGLPATYLLNRAVTALCPPESDDDSAASDSEHGGSLEARPLPWQTGAWPARVRIGVTALAPLLMAAAGWRFGLAQAALVSLFVLAMLLCTATDLIRFRVPNVITYPGTVIAFSAASVLPGGDPIGSAIAALIGSGIFFLLALVTRGGLGLGDVKLAMFIGAALGFPIGYHALVLGVCLGGISIAALFAAGVVSRRQPVPYAPFLAITAAVLVLVEGAAFAPI